MISDWLQALSRGNLRVMMLAPVWRTRLFAGGGVLLAIWLGFAIAQEDLMLPMFGVGIAATLLLLTVQTLPVTTVLLGGILTGYIVGNRGFAQLYLAHGLPILPAELVLVLGAGLLMVQSAFRRELPIARDGLSYAILAWMAVATVRFLFDFGAYGITAMRDFAVVYYAAFFFLAQSAGQALAGRRFLEGCLKFGFAALVVTQLLYTQFPEFFFNVLTVRGTPLIYYKGDLVGTFLVIGAVIFFLRFERDQRWWDLLLCLIQLVMALSTNNRASLVGLTLVTAALLLRGRWKFAALQGGGVLVGIVAVLIWSQATGTSWQKTPLYSMYERVVSIADPLGTGSYSGEDTFYKGDNNLFRSVWWRNVFDETMEKNPYVGLGFGYSLADRFVREYYPEASEEFTTRSPHNVLLTIFARMGLVGFLPFLVILGYMGKKTWHSIGAGIGARTWLWCGAWIIFVSACFGVVLEGPMGAVLFWTMAGLATVERSPAMREEAKELSAAGDATLQAAPADAGVAVE